MPITPAAAPDESGYTPDRLEAMPAAGEIELVRPGTPEADAWDRAMAAQIRQVRRT